METEEVIKRVDGIYKNILDKFNPGARQLISAGKLYLKALNGSASASRVFNESLAKIALNAQQGGTADVGSALMNIVSVYKEIQDQHMNILKAFYVDLLVPLETNLEKDTKVIQFEQKKFLQLHKVRMESFAKAMSTMKKQRKKKPNPQNADKEIRSMKALDDEKNKLDQFCEQSLKNAMTQERRRYGFVLERQCSLAKHWMAYHAAGKAAIEESMDNWQDVASTREFLPPSVDSMFGRRGNHHRDSNMQRIDHFSEDEEDCISISSQMRKTKSIDASCLDMKSLGDVANQMPRAKSEYSLTTAIPSSAPSNLNDIPHWDQRPMVRALYAYLSSGENQLSFLEGDQIALVGERAKGWQFGENLRTQQFGWFPIAYTGDETSPGTNFAGLQNYLEQQHPTGEHDQVPHDPMALSSEESIYGVAVPTIPEGNSPSTRMFGDTLMYKQSKQLRGAVNMMENGHPHPGPPPTLPAPVPNAASPMDTMTRGKQLTQSQSFSSGGGPMTLEKRPKSIPATINFTKQQNQSKTPMGKNGVTNASLHSSNDSGFAIDPPPQPEVDYSDEDSARRVPIRTPPTHYDTPKGGKNTDRSSYPAQSSHNTLQRTSMHSPMRLATSHSHGNLTDENSLNFMNGDRGQVKRTKSFWKFGKSDYSEDIVEGMAMWRHRDLIQPEQDAEEERYNEDTIKRNMNNKASKKEDKIKSTTMERKEGATKGSVKTMQQNITVPMIDDHTKYQLTKAEIDSRIAKSKERYQTENTETELGYAEDEDDLAFDEAIDENLISAKTQNLRMKAYESQDHKFNNKIELDADKFYDDMMVPANRFYDDESIAEEMMVMKTVKRKDILRQYYSSDTERHSSSSDPYDCIVIEDQVPRNKNNVFNNNMNSNRRNNKNKEMSTFSKEMNGKNKKASAEQTATVLPRTKLAKNGKMNTTASTQNAKSSPETRGESAKNKPLNVDPKKVGRKNYEESFRNSLSSTKSYGPWYDLWGANPADIGTMKNNTLISKK